MQIRRPTDGVKPRKFSTRIRCLYYPFTSRSIHNSLQPSLHSFIEGASRSLPPTIATASPHSLSHRIQHHSSLEPTINFAASLCFEHQYKHHTNRRTYSRAVWVSGTSNRYARTHLYRYAQLSATLRRWWAQLVLRRIAMRATLSWPTRLSSKAPHHSHTSQLSS